MCPLYIIYHHVNSKLGYQHTRVPLAAAISSFMSRLPHISKQSEGSLTAISLFPKTLPYLMENFSALDY